MELGFILVWVGFQFQPSHLLKVYNLCDFMEERCGDKKGLVAVVTIGVVGTNIDLSLSGYYDNVLRARMKR